MLVDVKTLVWSHGLSSHALCCRRPSSTSSSSSYSWDKVEDIMMEDNINIKIKVDGNNIETSIHLKPTYDILNGAIELFP